MSTKIKSPTYPESVEDGVIAKWVVKEGQDAKQDDVIAEIETDKVVIDPSKKIYFNDLIELIIPETKNCLLYTSDAADE